MFEYLRAFFTPNFRLSRAVEFSPYDFIAITTIIVLSVQLSGHSLSFAFAGAVTWNRIIAVIGFGIPKEVEADDEA